MKIVDKIKIGAASAAGACTMAVTPVFATGGEGGSTANADVVAAFTTAAGEVQATVVAIAGVAVGILIVMYAFKWGKKIFNRVAS